MSVRPIQRTSQLMLRQFSIQENSTSLNVWLRKWVPAANCTSNSIWLLSINSIWYSVIFYLLYGCGNIKKLSVTMIFIASLVLVEYSYCSWYCYRVLLFLICYHLFAFVQIILRLLTDILTWTTKSRSMLANFGLTWDQDECFENMGGSLEEKT